MTFTVRPRAYEFILGDWVCRIDCVYSTRDDILGYVCHDTAGNYFNFGTLSFDSLDPSSNLELCHICYNFDDVTTQLTTHYHREKLNSTYQTD